MAFRDDVLAVLAGGLPTLIEPTGATTAVEPRPEETPPEPQLQDREPFLLGRGITMNQALIGGAALLGVVGLVLVARAL